MRKRRQKLYTHQQTKTTLPFPPPSFSFSFFLFHPPPFFSPPHGANPGRGLILDALVVGRAGIPAERSGHSPRSGARPSAHQRAHTKRRAAIGYQIRPTEEPPGIHLLAAGSPFNCPRNSARAPPVSSSGAQHTGRRGTHLEGARGPIQSCCFRSSEK